MEIDAERNKNRRRVKQRNERKMSEKEDDNKIKMSEK